MLKKILSGLFVAGAVGVICYCGYQILTTAQNYALADKEYVNIKDSYVSAINEDKDPDIEDTVQAREKKTSTNGTDPGLNVDHEGLLKINSDYIGWIYYKDGDISYPVTKADESNPDYYLDHSFEGQEVSSGCIFIDTNASEDFSDANTFLYGHNMYNGIMMGSVKKIYQSPSDYSDPYIYLYLKDGTKKTYRVFAMYVTNENDSKSYMIPKTSEVMRSYIDRTLRLGKAYTNVEYTDKEKDILMNADDQKLITLSTCFGRAGTTQRLLVHGVLVNES